ncbi:MAG: DUF2232 domain-containing protein [Limnochordaceae bacterium]|nr:DUF2232 domain-containing protein [Limnochordaceae bacterium]
MLAAVTVVLAWLSLYVPFLAMVLPAPITLLIFRYGPGTGVMAWVVTALLSGVLGGGIGSVLMLVPAGLLSLGLGVSLHRKWSPRTTLWVATGAGIVATLASLGISLGISGVNPIETFLKIYEESFTKAAGWYRGMGIPEEQVKLLEEAQKGILTLVRLLFPAGILWASLVSAFVNHWAVRQVLGRMGEKLEWFAPFARWRSSMAGPIALGAGSLLPLMGLRQGAWEMVSANLLVVGGLICLVQGLSLLWFWLERLQVSKGVRLLLVFLLMFWTPALAVGGAGGFAAVSLGQIGLGVAGFFDPWFNFRRL